MPQRNDLATYQKSTDQTCKNEPINDNSLPTYYQFDSGLEWAARLFVGVWFAGMAFAFVMTSFDADYTRLQSSIYFIICFLLAPFLRFRMRYYLDGEGIRYEFIPKFLTRYNRAVNFQRDGFRYIYLTASISNSHRVFFTLDLTKTKQPAALSAWWEERISLMNAFQIDNPQQAWHVAFNLQKLTGFEIVIDTNWLDWYGPRPDSK